MKRKKPVKTNSLRLWIILLLILLSILWLCESKFLSKEPAEKEFSTNGSSSFLAGQKKSPQTNQQPPSAQSNSLTVTNPMVTTAPSSPSATNANNNGQISANALKQIAALEAEKAKRTPVQQKIDSQLLYADKMRRGLPIAEGVATQRLNLDYDNQGRILVDIKANVTQSLLKYIATLGGNVINSFPEYRAIQAGIPLSEIENLAAQKEVTFIRPVVHAMQNNVDSEGDYTHQANAARVNFGVNGTGVKVGVISDSVDHLAGSQIDGLVTVLPGQDGMPDTGEGTAMLEIVNDLAPGAQLYFATRGTSEAQFASNIRNLRSTYGCDIIVDDILYDDESPFQDGIVAQAVNAVTASGAMYFSSASNSGNKDDGTSGTWEGDFVNGGTTGAPINGKSGFIHSFGSANYDAITKTSSANAGTILFWADPLNASTNDYDLFVLDSTGTVVVDSSTTTQNGTQDPIEEVYPTNAGERIVVVLASGTGRFLHIDTQRGQLAVSTQGSTRGHNCATNAFDVAATDARNSYPNSFVGGAANPVETYSSDGPRRVFFQSDGTPITPGNFSSSGGAVRQKPDITAADGVTTDVPGFAPFTGTSAAAPHAAAIAALLKSYNQSLTASQIRTILTNTALDIMSYGVDRNSGAGIVMALPALQQAPIPTPVVAPTSISGTAIGGVITSGAWPFIADSGYFLLVPADSGNSCQLIEISDNAGVYDISTDSASYSYSASGAVGNLQLSNGSEIDRGNLNYSTTNLGNYSITNISVAPILATQTGNYQLYQRAVPASIAGKTFNIVINDGVPPFAQSGTSSLIFAASGNKYASLGDGINSIDSSGTYSYSRLNLATGLILLNDSVGGALKCYLVFSSAVEGTYLATQASSGSFQVGHFILVDTTSPSLSIKSPIAGARLTNALITVQGTATDDVQVAGVGYQLNTNDWAVANGSTNWTASNLLLLPGTNIFRAYAQDTSGNRSATNQVSFVYALSAVLTVQTNGNGTISPNYNGALLQIGSNYTMKATAATGFSFAGWTGSIVTNGATLKFTMASNLMFTANFADVTKPTLSITNVTAGMSVSNAAFMVKGKAGDNVAVSNVFYSFNNMGWNNAITGNNWANWTTVMLTLMPGTNTIAAYAVDTSGNFSTTNTLKFVYVVSAILTVTTNGNGTVSPNDNGALLQTGKSYSITAKAGTGFAFTNWTGGTNLPLNFITNKTTVQFLMQSNLMLQANFVDVTKPTLSITNLAAGQRVSNNVFSVRGKAGDNWQVANVSYQLNSDAWSNAVTANNWTNWSATVTLTPGTNFISAYAADSTGNSSMTNTVSFQYVVTNQLQIRANGLGAIKPNYSNVWLEIGRNYSITSAPASGFIFTNWTISTNWLGNATTTKTNLQFMMASNLTLQANFLDVTRPTLTISSPANGQHMTNALATLLGMASDNWKVSGVWYQLNNGAWTAAATSNSYTNWASTLLTLVAGTNSVKAYAMDLSGNFSTTNSVSFVSSNSFQLQLNFTMAQPLANNGLNFALQVSTNLTGHIQVSTNLLNWTMLTNFVGSNSVIYFRDSSATNFNRRFYRAVIP